MVQINHGSERFNSSTLLPISFVTTLALYDSFDGLHFNGVAVDLEIIIGWWVELEIARGFSLIVIESSGRAMAGDSSHDLRSLHHTARYG